MAEFVAVQEVVSQELVAFQVVLVHQSDQKLNFVELAAEVELKVPVVVAFVGMLPDLVMVIAVVVVVGMVMLMVTMN